MVTTRRAFGGIAAGLAAGALLGAGQSLSGARRATAAPTAPAGPKAEIQPPQLPIRLDGRKVEPRNLARHAHEPLRYVVTPDTFRDGELQVFRRPEAANEYVADVQQRFTRASLGPRSRPAPPTQPARAPEAAGDYTTNAGIGYYGPVGGMVVLHEHWHYQGGKWQFNADWGSQRDFRSVFCFLWCSNINDKVSSVDTNVSYIDGNIPYIPYTILFEHIELQGQQLWLYNGNGVDGPGLYPDLGVFGWNDVASSMRYY
ncbi:hypothetical protein [Micromonospora globbae]|uniref:Uncharacterized protein n=1 Tax=Micromonospora globbae TaxID=1894969 RepID=A0A420EV07_9ACTN|nr:hypothetical protein [Micromonospora globbae]RKF24555.1 hypothetical protein D7I43_25655 [Micromonospora globbae]